MKIRITLFLVLAFTLGAPTVVFAQEGPAQPTEEQQLEKAEKEKKAFTLLDSVVEESQMFRLPENRARIQISAAEMLWQRDQGRARSLFSLAADAIAEMIRNASMNQESDRRRSSNQGRGPLQLRQELVLTAARYDAQLAYQLLAATKQTTAPDTRIIGNAEVGDTLEQRLLAEIAALDPKLALQNAEQLLDKGQYSRSLASVLAQLYAKDKEAAARLEDKMIKKLQSANMLASPDAGILAMSLLRAGPRAIDNPIMGRADSTSNPNQLLGLSTYTGLLGAVIDNAVKATPQQAGNRNANRPRVSNNNAQGRQNSGPNEPTAAEIEQGNARRLLAGLQFLLPEIDQYLPGRAQAVRQKMIENGMRENNRAGAPTLSGRPSTSETLMALANQVPPQSQSRVYEQAALRAVEEGNMDRARQIANDYLELPLRDSILKTIESRVTAEKLGTNMNEVRQALGALRSDDERIDMLLRLSNSSKKSNPEHATKLLEEARQYMNRRASSYRHFDQHLKLAIAFSDLAPESSFEVLEPVVSQLNELLSAAATLNGFELNLFKDGELPLEVRSGLSEMVAKYGEVLGQLAKSDFDRSQILANRFQLAEPRILARMSIVRGLLGIQSQGRRTNSSAPRFFGTEVTRLPQ